MMRSVLFARHGTAMVGFVAADAAPDVRNRVMQALLAGDACCPEEVLRATRFYIPTILTIRQRPL